MTKHFSNQRRDDMRPSSRNASSGRYREEQSFKPARPRLSRDAVDRAWENGASRTYADYRPRQNAQTPPAQRQGRPSSAPYRSQPQNRRPYEPRQEPYRSSPPFHSGYQQRSEGGQRAPGERPGFSGERWNRGPAPQQRGYSERYHDERPPRYRQERPTTPERPGFRNENGPRPFERQDRPERGPRPFERRDRPERGPRPFERGERERENFARGRRSGGPQAARRDSSHPRWQSRPAAQQRYQEQPEYPPARRDYPAFRQERSYDQPGAAQFEGDYEHFDTRGEQPESGYEKHVTRLPDGRVLKGSRPSQRQQARFWTGVEEEASSLVPEVPPTPTRQIQEPEQLPTVQEAPATRAPRPRKRPESATGKVKTVKTARPRDAGDHAETGKAGKKKARGPQGPVTRPSQRGYKWPTADQG